MEGIQIAVETTGAQKDLYVVKISGYIDTTTSGELERVIQGLLREQHYKIIIDLQSVDYISSAGWGIFISEIKNIRTHHGDLKLALMSETVNEVYELLEFSTILTSANTVADAVRLFEPGTAPVEKSQPKPVVAAPAKFAPPPNPAPQPVAPRVTPAAVRPVAPQVTRPAAASAPSPVSVVQPAAASQPAMGAPKKPSSSLLPLIDRIRGLVKAHPDWGAWKLKNELNFRRGSQPKVSWGEVRAELKYNNLGSKKNRFKFARDI
ncbi:STAS domain-containing protein [bacterium]|nr:STAS domain-containing protein [bacterium]